MRATIDRFEEEYAVCEKENGEMINIERFRLPEGAREGDVLVIEDENIIVDHEKTEKLKEEIEKLMDELWE